MSNTSRDEGFCLAYQVALTALELSDGYVYSADYKAQQAAASRYAFVKKQLDAVAEAYGINVQSTPGVKP